VAAYLNALDALAWGSMAPTQQHRDFLLLALLTGARRGNLQAMQWADVGLQAKVWHIPASDAKAGAEIEVPLVPAVVEVLQRRGSALYTGRRRRSRATILGMPVLHIAQGPWGDEVRGRARGFIAIGDDARGFLAVGGIARGVVAIGGVAIGGFSLGGVALGGIAIGGAVLGLIASGGAAAGGVSVGGGSVGIIADGGLAFGVFARGQPGVGPFVDTASINATPADRLFDALSWFFGPGAGSPTTIWQPTAILAGVGTLVAATLVAVAIRAWSREPGWDFEEWQ